MDENMRPHGAPQIKIYAETPFLVLDQSQWVHRRVEYISFTNDETLRRRVSLDFITHAALPRNSSNNKVRVIPLTFLRKGLVERLDVVDESGRTLPVYTTEQNAQFAEEILIATYEHVADEPPSEPIRVAMSNVIRATEHEGEEATNLLLSILRHPQLSLEELKRVEVLEPLIRLFATSFLLLTEIESGDSERRIVKFAYERPLVMARTKGHRFRNHYNSWSGKWDYQASTPSIDRCQSYHVEFESPPSIWVTSTTTTAGQQITNTSLLHKALFYGTSARRTSHIHLTRQLGEVEKIIFHLRVMRRGWLQRAALSCLAVAVFMLISAINLPQADDKSSGAISLLMAFFAVLATLVIRDTDHPTTSQVQAGLSTITFAVIGMPVIGAIYLQFAPNSGRIWPWVVLAVLSNVGALIVCRAAFGWRNPRNPDAP